MNYFTRTKDKRGLLTKFVLFMLLFLGSSGAWADTYKKVTSATELTTDGEYLIVGVRSSKSYVMTSVADGSNMKHSEITSINTEGEITSLPTDADIITLNKDNETGYYSLKLSSNSQYLYATKGKSSLLLTVTETDANKWIINFNSDGSAAIKFYIDGVSGDRYISTQSANFTTKTSDNQSVYLYKKTTGGSEPVTPVITADPTSFSIPAAGNTGNKVTCTITNPIDGTNIVATSSETWVKNINVSGNNVTFDVDANDKEETRSATITLNYGTAEAVTVTVNQAAKAATVDPGMEEVPDPMVKTLTYSTTKGLFDEEETLSNGEGIPYYGAIAVNAAYADMATGAFVDMSDKVSGIIFKFDDATTSWTADDFKNHRVAGITTVSTRSALMAIEGRHENLKLYVIAYHIKDGVRSYSNLVVRNYKYVEDERKELTLKSSESPFTLELTEAKKTSDEQGTLFNDVKTVTISATDADGNNVDLSGLSFISRSSNRKLALSHMTLNGTTETTAPGNTTLLMDKGRRAGVITVLIATPGNTDYLPAFLKVNVVLRDNTIGALATTPGTVYTSIADLRTAGRQNPKKPCVIEFNETNPATVVAKFNYDDGSVGEPNTIFIVDNSGYGLRIGYSNSNAGKREQKFIDDYKLVPGTSFTGTIYANYNDLIASSSPSLRNLNLAENGSVTINEKVYTTQITPDHSGEGIMENGEIIGANIPVTAIADVNTPNADRGDTSKDQISRAERPYVNTVVTIPGMIKKDENAKNEQDRYFLVQSKDYSTDNKPYAIFLSATQMPEINLDNYVGLEGVLTGLLTKRDDSSAKLTITRGSFFEADEVAEFVLDEQDVEGYVGKAFETGALTSERSVTVKIHRKGWTTDTWGTICLPFDLTADEFKATFGQDITGLRQCKGTVSGNVLEFEDVADKNIKAGVPYLIKVGGTITNGTANGKITDETKDANYYATVSDANGPVKKLFTEPVPKKYRVENINTDGKDIVGTTVEFRGLYGKKTYIDGSTTEKIAGDQRYQYISTKAGQPLCYLPETSTNSFAGLRAYLFFPEWNAEKNGAAQPTNTLLTLGLGDGTTTIGGIAADEATDGKVFNLAGQYVGNSADGLAKGIYIRNGKKFIVK